MSKRCLLDDPPLPKHVGAVGLEFGSWYSTTGNIIGEAGVPYEVDADKQRSVSYYYSEVADLAKR